MLAATGTTTAIDFGGTPEQLIDGMHRLGAGLNVGGLFIMVPGTTIPADDPPKDRVRKIVDQALVTGALGIKMTGGYHPFTPEVTSNVIEECNNRKAYVGFHVGTKATGSRLDGLREVPELVGRGRLHVAHINAYCRGSILEPSEECNEALDILEAHQGQYVSEVHQAVPNSTSGRCDKEGRVMADVARNCLRLRGYVPSSDGVRQAIREGYASAIIESNDEVKYVRGKEALGLFEKLKTDCPLSFPVNLPSTAFRLTTAKGRDGQFIVDAIATDGGSHPRNVAIQTTMALVKLGALSPLEAVTKLSWNPSKMVGLLQKGHFSSGADADVTLIDPDRGIATMSLVRGQMIMKDGQVVGTGGTLMVTPDGEQSGRNCGLPYEVVDLTKSKLYAGYKR
jgi:hypothetical protein